MKVARRHRASRRGKGRGHISRMNADAAQIAKRAMEGDALLKNFRSALHIALPHEEVAKVAEGKGQPVLRAGGAQLGHSRYPPLDRRIEVTSKPRDQLACVEQLAVCGARSAFLGQGDPFINPGLCLPWIVLHAGDESGPKEGSQARRWAATQAQRAFQPVASLL